MENNYFKQYYCSWFRHPIDNLFTFFRGLKFALQRATRGYSTKDTWDIEYYLSTIIPAMLKEYKKNLHGYPAGLTEEKWDSILNEIIEGFEAARRVMEDDYYIQVVGENWDGSERLKKEEIEKIRQLSLADQELFQSKMKLFAEYFFNLWD